MSIDSIIRYQDPEICLGCQTASTKCAEKCGKVCIPRDITASEKTPISVFDASSLNDSTGAHKSPTFPPCS